MARQTTAVVDRGGVVGALGGVDPADHGNGPGSMAAWVVMLGVLLR